MARSKSDGIPINKLAKTREGVHKQIQVYLKRSGLGDGPKLRKILVFAYDHGGHFTKTDVPFRIDTHDLDKLVKAGFIARICVDNIKGKHSHLYESKIGNKPSHSHLVCDTCEKLIEFDDKMIHELMDKISEYFEFERHRVQIQTNGRCKECRSK